MPDAEAPCQPIAGGPYWLEEGDRLTFAVSCASGLKLGPDGFSFDSLPAGAVYDSETGLFDWTPGLDQAAVYNLVLTVAGTGERATIKIGVADRYNDPDNAPVVSFVDYPEEFGVPVINLATSPAFNIETYTDVRVTFRGHVYKGQGKFRGHSSLDYLKKSFTLKFSKDDRFDEPAHGFRLKRKVAITTTFDDNSYVRHRMAYEVWNRVTPGPVKMQSFSAVLFGNGQYIGLYEVTDWIDGNLMEDSGLAKDGNLYKALTHAANFAAKPDLAEGYLKTEGVPADGQPGAYDDLKDMVGFVANSQPGDFQSNVRGRLDLGDYRAWVIMTTAVLGTDSFGKNSFHYHDPQQGLWRVVPWDFNASFGQNWNTTREPPTGDPDEIAPAWNVLFDRLMHDEVLGPATRARYRAVVQNEIRVATILALYEGMIAEIAPSARRDEKKWRPHYLTFTRWADRTDFTTFDGEVVYMRQWIKDRWAWLEAKFNGPAADSGSP